MGRWSALSSSISTAPSHTPPTWVRPTAPRATRRSSRRTAMRSIRPSSMTITPATTASSTASIRSVRRPTRPGCGPASVISPGPAAWPIRTSRAWSMPCASRSESDGGVPGVGCDHLLPPRGRTRHRRLLELGLAARSVPRPGRPPVLDRRQRHLGPCRITQAAPRHLRHRRLGDGCRRRRNRLRRRFLGARRPRAATDRHDGRARLAGRRAGWAPPAGAPGRRPPRRRPDRRARGHRGPRTPVAPE